MASRWESVQDLLAQASKGAERARRAHWDGNVQETVEWIARAQIRLDMALAEVREVTDGTDEANKAAGTDAPAE
jgi:hypothetical protein